jgi:hypothetical protein
MNIRSWRMFLESRARPPPSVIRLSKQGGIYKLTQPYWPPRPVTEIALLFTREWCSYLTGDTPIALNGLLRRQLCLFIYADDFRTSQETHLWASTSCYADCFLVYMQMIFVPHGIHAYMSPRPVTGIAVLFVCRWCSYLTGSTPVGLHGLLLR